jgi:(p)ppGpp synthase/HD superfamily hydrolase
MEKYVQACDFAAKKHSTQRRKDPQRTPYINHPLEVASFLSRHGVTDADTLCAAVLHDTIEDTETTPEELALLFGTNVRDIVLECTDDKNINKTERKKLQIEHASHASDSAKLVKLADKWSNISGLLESPPSFWPKERIYGYVKWGLAVCKNCYGINPLVDLEVSSLFAKFGIDSVTNHELDEYYKTLNDND